MEPRWGRICQFLDFWGRDHSASLRDPREFGKGEAELPTVLCPAYGDTVPPKH